MIKIHDLKKNYPDFSLFIEKMDIPENTITGLVGANGSGKTTLFRLLCGLARPEGGSAEVLNASVWQLPPEIKQKIGVVFNASGYPESLTVQDIARVQKVFYPSFNENQYNMLTERFSLPPDKPVASFSTGMKAALKVICAITHQPLLLLLDEPTNGLDVINRHEIHGLLQEFMEIPGRSIIISSHIASDLEQLCDDFWMIRQGRIQLHETVDALQNEYGILTLSQDQFDVLDKTAVIGYLPDAGGVKVLVSDRKFYEENYPGIVLDKGNIDDLELILEKGEKI